MLTLPSTSKLSENGPENAVEPYARVSGAVSGVRPGLSSMLKLVRYFGCVDTF